MTIQQKFIPILCLIVGLAVGYGVETWRANADMTTVRARLIDLHLISADSTQMKLLKGSIKSINGNIFTITLLNPKDPFDDPSLDERTVTVDSNTKITVESSKDSVVYNKEFAAWRTKSNTSTTTRAGETTPPLMTEKKAGTLSSLQVGKTITITTTENVKTQKSFVAQSINIINLVMAFGPPPPSL